MSMSISTPRRENDSFGIPKYSRNDSIDPKIDTFIASAVDDVVTSGIYIMA